MRRGCGIKIGFALGGQLRGALFFLHAGTRLLRRCFGLGRRDGVVQRGQQRRHRCGPPLRVPGKAALQHAPLAAGQSRRLGWLVAVAAHAIKRHTALHHLVDHHRYRIHVKRLSRLALQRPGFRGAVAGRARITRRFQTDAAGTAACARGDAEVEQLDFAIGGDEHVAWLDITVHQLVLVPRVLERFAHGRKQRLHTRQRQRPFARQQAVEVFAFEAFHDDEVARRGRVLGPFVDAHDVFMCEPARLGRLLHQQLGVRGR